MVSAKEKESIEKCWTVLIKGTKTTLPKENSKAWKALKKQFSDNCLLILKDQEVVEKPKAAIKKPTAKSKEEKKSCCELEEGEFVTPKRVRIGLPKSTKKSVTSKKSKEKKAAEEEEDD